MLLPFAITKLEIISGTIVIGIQGHTAHLPWSTEVVVLITLTCNVLLAVYKRTIAPHVVKECTPAVHVQACQTPSAHHVQQETPQLKVGPKCAMPAFALQAL